MDFLDPQKQKQHARRLLLGYVLIGVALVMATTILLYQAYGFGLDKNGQVIQNGLVFVSSQPSPANIYINGKPSKSQTNTRLNLPAGQYTFELQRDGYRTWRRAVNVEGGSVQHFDYPFLFPTDLKTAALKKYPSPPSIMLQSPDRRWLMTQSGDNFAQFELLDLNNKTPLTTLKTLTLPDGVVSASTGAQRWELQEWSTDNRHVLLKHSFQKNGQDAHEYVVVDRQDPAQSTNLTNLLGSGPTRIELRNKAYDQYWLFNQPTGALQTATLKQPTPQAFLEHVAEFTPHGTNMVLYASNEAADRIDIKLRDGDKTYTLRQEPLNTTYLLELTQYSGDWYIGVGATSDNRVYVYKDPQSVLGDNATPLVPVSILKVANPSYLAFSDNARFIMAEQGTNFALYDAETDKSYAYQVKFPIDAPQTHATWMDGHRIMAVSDGKVTVFDFDSANAQTLSPANATYQPVFDQRYRVLYDLAAPAEGGTPLNATPMLTPQDQ